MILESKLEPSLFYQYIKKCQNDVFWTDEEEVYLKIYKEFYENC